MKQEQDDCEHEHGHGHGHIHGHEHGHGQWKLFSALAAGFRKACCVSHVVLENRLQPPCGFLSKLGFHFKIFPLRSKVSSFRLLLRNNLGNFSPSFPFISL
jgi:hypothetical protein